MPNDSSTLPPLEQFIQEFNRFEAEAGLFAMRDGQGYPWWDLVRYRVQFALCVERGIYGRAPPAPPRSRGARIRYIAEQSLRLVRNISRLHGRRVRSAGTLVVSRRSLDYIETVAEESAAQGKGILYVNRTGDSDPPDIAIDYQNVQFVTRMLRRVQVVPPDVERHARRASDDIRARFGSDVNVFAEITAKYREELAIRRIWSFVLGKAHAVRRVIYANDDMLKSLVLQARTKQMTTEEVQHAYMGRSHIGYSYPELQEPLPTLPDMAIVTRDTGDIVYPVKRLAVRVSPKGCAFAGSVREIDVLIGSSPSRQKEAAEIANALSGQGICIAVKLHPAETREGWEAAAGPPRMDVVVHDGLSDFRDIAARSKLFIPANPTSTTSYEAADMGARVILAHLGGAKTTSAADSVASAQANSLGELLELVRAQLSGAEERAHPASVDRK